MSIAMTLQNPREVAAATAAQARGAADMAREQAQAAREAAQAQREAAQAVKAASREAAQAQRDARNAGQDAGAPVTVTITTADGKTITLQNPSADALAQVGFPVKEEQQRVDPGPYVIGGVAITAGAIVMLVALTYLFRWKMRSAGGQSALPADLTQRLSRMEAGIESVAVEVERISEGQRFTTRLLSDRERLEVPRG